METKVGVFRIMAAAVMAVALLNGCIWDGSSGSDGSGIVVNSLEDTVNPATAGTVTLRDAIDRAEPGERITFDPALNGGTIDLENVGAWHSTLRGEVFSPAFGFIERDYGPSALYARKNLVIDASGLQDGITLDWAGGEENPARVLAVYGDLTMENVNISSGVSSAVALTAGDQPYTLARGGGVAVWGVARLVHCEISGSRAAGEAEGSRDRGAFGGGIYGDVIILEDCVVSGNSVKGYGAAGGGVYSVGGRDSSQHSSLTRCAVTGNRIAGQHAYGGGVYSDGGGRGNRKIIALVNCTLARNLVEDNADLPEVYQWYYRGGGFYMSNGDLKMEGCTIAENQVNALAFTFFNGKPNMGGGGVGATIGDAHVVEKMQIQHSIIAGNSVDGVPGDLFSGSLINFFSLGYNLIGDLNFDYILVPVPWWSEYMSRKHWPKAGDMDGVDVADVLLVEDPQLHPTILSAGVDEGEPAVLWYPPTGNAVDAIPASGYSVSYVLAGFDTTSPFGEGAGFLNLVLEEIDSRYGRDYSAVFGTQNLSEVTFHGPAETWPSEPENAEWIAFWQDLDAAIAESPGPYLGTEKLADDFWVQPFADGENVEVESVFVVPPDTDQLGQTRPVNGFGDIGAIEIELP